MTYSPRIFLADPSLRGHSGHCFDYLASLDPSARERGFTPVYLGNRAVAEELRNQRGVLAVFTHWCDARYDTPERTRRVHETDLARELLEVSRRFAVTPSDVFLINTLRHWALRGVVDWLEALSAASRPRVALVLHFTAYPNPAVDDGTPEFYRQAFAHIARSPVRDRIALLTDSDALIDEYRTLTRHLSFTLAPIPHTREQQATPRESGTCRVGYIGEARVNKGFPLLPRLVRRAAESGLRNIEFHFHSFAHDPSAEFLRRALAGLRHPSVTLYSRELPAAEYERFVNSLDIAVLPYTLDNYHAQTSGVFAEAMAGGSLIVAPKGSWMARQLCNYGGGATFNPDDAEDFSRVTLKVIAQRDRFATRTPDRVTRWRQFHNPGRLLQLICQ